MSSRQVFSAGNEEEKVPQTNSTEQKVEEESKVGFALDNLLQREKTISGSTNDRNTLGFGGINKESFQTVDTEERKINKRLSRI